ncbi:MAG: hypothetical protein QNJ94_03040 [Alphaproteobacteria bacterium]|nr:hypothetical protein [Alphaproteobacteria bacterium]
MIRRQADLPLEGDNANRFLPWLIAAMVYLAILALAAAMGLGTAVARWGAGLSGTLTVQLAPGPEIDLRIDQAVAALRATPGVAEIRVLSVEETRALLEPWLGPGNEGADLPLPRVLDVRVESGTVVDTESVAERLAAVAPGSIVDDHRKWLDDLIKLVRSVQWTAAAIVLLTAVCAVLTVVFATRTGLAVHHHVIELLHLIGARDRYVARQFQHHALRLGLRGGLIGTAAAGLTILLLLLILRSLDTPMLAGLVLTPAQWGVLAAPAVAAAVIAMSTARITVLRVLARMV